MRYFCIIMLFFTVGCSAKTTINSSDELLRPQTYKGNLEGIHELAYMAAKRAFPEEDAIFKDEGGKVRIERDWFWRGDTIIEVWVRKINENECIIEAESRANWHRGNGPIFDMSTDELKHYMSTIKLEYEDYINHRGYYKTQIIERLRQLKEAYESGLITEEEYSEKKKLILDKF